MEHRIIEQKNSGNDYHYRYYIFVPEPLEPTTQNMDSNSDSFGNENLIKSSSSLLKIIFPQKFFFVNRIQVWYSGLIRSIICPPLGNDINNIDLSFMEKILHKYYISDFKFNF